MGIRRPRIGGLHNIWLGPTLVTNGSWNFSRERYKLWSFFTMFVNTNQERRGCQGSNTASSLSHQAQYKIRGGFSDSSSAYSLNRQGKHPTQSSNLSERPSGKTKELLEVLTAVEAEETVGSLTRRLDSLRDGVYGRAQISLNRV